MNNKIAEVRFEGKRVEIMIKDVEDHPYAIQMEKEYGDLFNMEEALINTRMRISSLKDRMSRLMVELDDVRVTESEEKRKAEVMEKDLDRFISQSISSGVIKKITWID